MPTPFLRPALIRESPWKSGRQRRGSTLHRNSAQIPGFTALPHCGCLRLKLRVAVCCCLVVRHRCSRAEDGRLCECSMTYRPTKHRESREDAHLIARSTHSTATSSPVSKKAPRSPPGCWPASILVMIQNQAESLRMSKNFVIIKFSTLCRWWKRGSTPFGLRNGKENVRQAALQALLERGREAPSRVASIHECSIHASREFLHTMSRSLHSTRLGFVLCEFFKNSRPISTCGDTRMRAYIEADRLALWQERPRIIRQTTRW